jgi:hypothetical protein
MKRLFLIAGLMAAFLLVVVTASAQKANFAGAWSLDKAKSQGLSPRDQGADKVTLTITQDATTISLDRKVEGGQPPAGGGGGGTGGGGGGGRGPAGPQSFNLDGKEVSAEVTFGQNTGTRTTKATLAGGNLELMTKNAFGERVSTITQKLSLSADGKTLTVVTHREGGQQATPDSTAVYTKQ